MKSDQKIETTVQGPIEFEENKDFLQTTTNFFRQNSPTLLIEQNATKFNPFGTKETFGDFNTGLKETMAMNSSRV